MSPASLQPAVLRLLTAALALGTACAPPGWSVVAEDLPQVPLSVWGPAERGTADQAFVVGGGLGTGEPALFARLEEGAWTRLDAPDEVTLWWVFGFSASEVYAVGEQGTVLRYDGTNLVALPTPTTATLFGVWGASPQDLWAVGGSPQGGGPNDVLLHYDGAHWTQVPPPEALGVAYLKVWGTSREDVFVVGQQGVVLHFDGVSWARQQTPVRSPLSAVTGFSPNEVYSVGGPPAVFLRFDGQQWSEEPVVDEVPGLSGASAGAGGELFVVGLAGAKWRRSRAGRWVDDGRAQPHGDLHAVWVAPDGTALAVGGTYLAPPSFGQRRGTLAYFGLAPPGELR